MANGVCSFGKVTAALAYFARHGAVSPEGANPGEFILETVGAGVDARTNDRGASWAAHWAASPEAAELVRQIGESTGGDAGPAHGSDGDAGPAHGEDGDASECNASVLAQTRLLTTRMLLNQWRNPPYMYSKIWVHVLSAVLVGFTFFQVGTSPRDLQNRMFSVFFILFLCNAIVNVILARYFFASLHWMFREGPSHTYGWVAFASSAILSELPGAVLVTVLYYVLWYFPSGLPLGGEAAYMFLFLLTYEIFQVLLGLFMMALSPDLGTAGNVLVFIICTCNWFNGVIVPYGQIQVFWRYWVSCLSPSSPSPLSPALWSDGCMPALLPLPVHVPPRRHGRSRHGLGARGLLPCGPHDLYAAAEPDVRRLRGRMGARLVGPAPQPGGVGPLGVPGLPLDHGRPVPGAVQPRRRAAGRPLGLLGHLRAVYSGEPWAGLLLHVGDQGQGVEAVLRLLVGGSGLVDL